MNEFFKKLREQANENPFAAVLVGGIALRSVAKLIEAAGGLRSKNAYANDRKRANKKG